MARELTFKQRMFVEFYLGDSKGNATDAARRAGYSLPKEQGRQLLRKPTIRAAVRARVASAAMTSSEVLARVADIASADITEFITIDSADSWKIDLRRIKARRKGHLIKKIRQTKDGPEIELESRLAALVKLGEFFSLWNQPQAGNSANILDALDDADNRAKQLAEGPAPAAPGPVEG
jgi:hypothetical protein